MWTTHQKGSFALEEGVAEGTALLINISLLKANLKIHSTKTVFRNFRSSQIVSSCYTLFHFDAIGLEFQSE